MNVVREDVENLVEKELEEMRSNMQSAWQWTKVDGNKYVMDELYSKIYKDAVLLACEAIQVAAMAKKEVDDGTAEIIDHGKYGGAS